MLRRTRIKAIANLPVRRAKDENADICESSTQSLGKHTSSDEVKKGSNIDSAVCDVPVTLSCTVANLSTSVHSEANSRSVPETSISHETGCVGVIRRQNELKDTQSVSEVQSCENGESQHQNTSENDIVGISQGSSSLSLAETKKLSLLGSEGNFSDQITNEQQPLQQNSTASQDVDNISSKSNLTVPEVDEQNKDTITGISAITKPRHAQSIPKLSSNKDASKKIACSNDSEDRHKVPKPFLPQLSSARGSRTLEQRKMCSNTNCAEKDAFTKHTQVKNIHRKVRSSITVRLNKAKQEFMSKYRDARPDRNNLTMFDLIYYNPVTNPMRKNEQQKTLGQPENNEVIIANADEEEDEPNVDADVDDTEQSSVPVPQVRLGADGQLIIDEKSLVIETTDTIKSKQLLANSSVVLDAGDGPSSYLAYNKKAKVRKSSSWTKIETLRFYVGLKTFGTDFLLMKSIFPQFSRQELKLKFKKEERINRDLVQEALRRQNFDPEQMKKDLDKLQEKEKCLEINNVDATVRKKKFVRLKKSTSKKSRVKRNYLVVSEDEPDNSSAEMSRAEQSDNSQDEAEVDVIPSKLNVISRNISRKKSTVLTSRVPPNDNLDTCNTNSGEDNEETPDEINTDINDQQIGTPRRYSKRICKISKKVQRNVKKWSSVDIEVSESEEMDSTEENTKRRPVVFSDSSEASRDKADADEEVCTITNTMNESVMANNDNSGDNNENAIRLREQMEFIQNEPLIMENELRRLVGCESKTPPKDGHAPLNSEVTTPVPGSLYILTSVSPTNPNHNIYKVFMVASSPQVQTASQSPH